MDITRMKSHIIDTHFTYRVLDDEGICIATCQIHRYGDVGIVYNMQGRNLLKTLIKDLMEGKLKKRGIKTLEGYVLPEVVRYIKAIEKFTKGGKATFGKTCLDDGLDLTWVTVERVKK